MALIDQLQHILLTSLKEFKIITLYFYQQPMIYVFFILAIIGIIGIVVMSTRKNKIKPVSEAPKNKIMHSIASSKDITAIAGDDVIATQLDLAKAYIEMDQKTLAKRILNDALKCGNTAQKNTARQLIETL